MANTVHGPYAKTTWVQGSTPANQTNMSNLETQSGVALASLNPDLVGSGFVLSGVACAKDGTIANQLDIASGEAYLLQSDGTLARCDVGSDTSHTTSALSSTYHLYLQPDGSWYWNTANSPAANSLAICTVTTDGSGNISAVTDARPTTISLFPSALGGVFPRMVAQAKNVSVTATTQQTILTYTPSVAGLYRINCSFVAHNGGVDKPSIGYSYTGGNTGLNSVLNQTLPGGTILNGTNTVSDNFEYPTTPQTFYAAAAAITCTYQNNAGTPNDHVTFMIERLA